VDHGQIYARTHPDNQAKKSPFRNCALKSGNSGITFKSTPAETEQSSIYLITHLAVIPILSVARGETPVIGRAP
jgi:hypothetical protein